MPNQEVLRQWVDALRSGEFRQGRNFLRNQADQYCCLGVLCELAVRAGVLAPPHLRPCDDACDCDECQETANVFVYGGRRDMPPQEVHAWAEVKGLQSAQDTLNFGALAHLNDQGKSFAEIADVIEEKWIVKEEANV